VTGDLERSTLRIEPCIRLKMTRKGFVFALDLALAPE
jgi:hypothetical protein